MSGLGVYIATEFRTVIGHLQHIGQHATRKAEQGLQQLQPAGPAKTSATAE